jgi:hypothetical protein
MNTLTRTEEHQTHPRTWTAFRSTKLLVGSYTSISVLTLVAVVVLRNHATIVNSAVWTHETIVAVSALLLFTFTVRAASGSRRAYLRLRIASAVMVVAIAVIFRSRHLPAVDEDRTRRLRARPDRRCCDRQRQAHAIAVRREVDQAHSVAMAPARGTTP